MSTRFTRPLLAAAAIAIIGSFNAGTAAQANIITYTFTNVALSDGGVLNGTITTSGFYGGLQSYDLTTSAGSVFGAQTYYSPNPNVADYAFPFNAPTTVDFFANSLGLLGYSYALQLTFSGDILDYGVTLVGRSNSFEQCSPYGGACSQPIIRYVDADFGGGFVSASPLPAALPLFAGGLGIIGLIGGRRRKSKKQIAHAAT